jgi:hypothetical protein
MILRRPNSYVFDEYFYVYLIRERDVRLDVQTTTSTAALPGWRYRQDQDTPAKPDARLTGPGKAILQITRFILYHLQMKSRLIQL